MSSAWPSNVSPGNRRIKPIERLDGSSMMLTVQPSSASRVATAEPTRPHPITTTCTSFDPSLEV